VKQIVFLLTSGLVAAAALFCSSVGQAADPMAALEDLRQVSMETIEWNVSVMETNKREDLPEAGVRKYRSQRAGDLLFTSTEYVERGRQKTAVLLQNFRYCATVGRFVSLP